MRLRSGIWLIVIAASAAPQAFADQRPYQSIVTRNPFQLHANKPATTVITVRKDKAPIVELTGLSTMKARSQALLKITYPNARFTQFLRLDEGHALGPVKVISIDIKLEAAVVTFLGEARRLRLKPSRSREPAPFSGIGK